jgi:hypothetical protein
VVFMVGASICDDPIDEENESPNHTGFRGLVGGNVERATTGSNLTMAKSGWSSTFDNTMVRVVAVSSPLGTFQLISPYENSWIRRPATRTTSPPRSAVAQIAREIADNTITGLYRVMVHGPSNATHGQDADDANGNGTTWPGNHLHGLILARAAGIVGILNVAAQTSASRRHFGFDCNNDAPNTSGTVVGLGSGTPKVFPAASGGMHRGWKGWMMNGGGGHGRGVRLEGNNAHIITRVKPEGTGDVSFGGVGTKMDRGPLTVRVYLLRAPYADNGVTVSMDVVPNEGTNQNGAGVDDVGATQTSALNTTIVGGKKVWDSADDSYTDGTKTLVINGTSLGILVGHGITIERDTGTEPFAYWNIARVTSVQNNVPSGKTTVVVEYSLIDVESGDSVGAPVDGNVLRWGPLGLVVVDHAFGTADVTNFWRGLKTRLVAPSGGFALLMGYDAWNHSATTGLIIGPLGKGGHSYENQIGTAINEVKPFRTTDGKLEWLNLYSNTDLSIVTLNPIGATNSTAAITDEIDLVGIGERVWTGQPDGGGLNFEAYSVFASINATAYGVPFVNIQSHATWGLYRDATCDGLFSDGRHQTMRGSKRYFDIALERLQIFAEQKAPPGSGAKGLLTGSGLEFGAGYD